MNNTTIFGAGLIAGSIFGVVGGILYQKKRDKKEIDAINKSYHDILEKQRNKIDELEEALEGTETSSLDEPEKFVEVDVVSEEELKEAFGKNYAYNYNAHSSSVAADPLMPKTDTSSIKEPEPRDPVESLHPVDSDEDPDEEALTDEEERYLDGLIASEERAFEREQEPRIIKDEDYGSDGRYAENSLLYYPDQDILCDENNEEILNPETVVGRTFEKFDFRNNHQDHMCIRNFKLGYDYWIVKQSFDYVPNE